MSYQWNVRSDPRAELRSNWQGASESLSKNTGIRGLDLGEQRGAVAIRLVESSETIAAACQLINNRYSEIGYGSGHKIPESLCHMTFTAEIGDEVIGTITLAVDSDQGLAADRTFKPELDRARATKGAKICELTKFAFAPDIRSRHVIAALFHVVFIYGYRKHACTDLFIEVHERHVRFYEAMLGFERVGPPKVNASVATELQLMRLQVSDIRNAIDRDAGTGDTSESRSLYPLFLSPADEEDIYDRLSAGPVPRKIEMFRPRPPVGRSDHRRRILPDNHSACPRRPALQGHR